MSNNMIIGVLLAVASVAVFIASRIIRYKSNQKFKQTK